MSLYFSSLNSGSNGNCYYIGNCEDAVLIDAGLSCRETEKRMARSGLEMSKVRAIFISHEHSDHIRGVEFISRKFKIPVYISKGTHALKQLSVDDGLLHYFHSNLTVTIGDLQVLAFSKKHDASDPHSFAVSGNGVTVGVLTDIGAPCSNVIHYFRQCNAAFLESNYDEEMLENGSYPAHLKKRISSSHGHLSNHQALELFTRHRPAAMSHLLLSHLSQENNDPEIVENLFKRHAGKTLIAIASRHIESQVYQITAAENAGSRQQTVVLKLEYIQPNLF